jgi:hypothetical protein
MKRRSLWVVLSMVAAFVNTPLAQKTTELGMGKGGSPHVRTEWTIDGANIAIEYGRPFLKGRTPGKDIDPYESSEWRTGADEQTALITDKRLKFGALSVPAGRHGLYTISIKGAWQLIVHTREKGWGIPYPGAAGDRGRVPMTMSTPPTTADQLTISIDDTPTGGTLHIDWGTTRASVPFTVG